jgi:hypothetical protein
MLLFFCQKNSFKKMLESFPKGFGQKLLHAAPKMFWSIYDVAAGKIFIENESAFFAHGQFWATLGI